MESNGMTFMALKGKLFLKLSQKDPDYMSELEEIKKMLPASPSYQNSLGIAMLRLVRLMDDEMLPDILKVVAETGCVSEKFIALERELMQLRGKTSDLQASGLKKLIREPFPEDADEDDKRGFYSEILDLAININDAGLITEVIHKIEELS